MPIDDILFDVEEHMEKALEHLRHELRGIRTGRASPALVEHVMVEYYGTPTPLKSIAAINVPEAMQILIKPFNPQDLKAIERGISDSKVGMTPHSDGKQLRLMLPPMSQETRLKMVGQCKGIAETAKVSIRNARRDGNKLVGRKGRHPDRGRGEEGQGTGSGLDQGVRAEGGRPDRAQAERGHGGLTPLPEGCHFAPGAGAKSTIPASGRSGT